MISNYFPAYLKEYQGQEYLETDFGFVTYKIIPETQTIFAPTVFVDKAYRKGGYGRDLMDEVSDIGRDADCRVLLGMVQMDYKGKETSLMAALSYGMKIVSSSATEIYLSKEL